jgi:hypothetical protein
MTVEMKNAAQMPVMMPPIGKIRICVPGMKNSEALGWEEVLVDVSTVLAASEKTPAMKLASLEARVVLATVPEAVDAERVTMGVRKPLRVALRVSSVSATGVGSEYIKHGKLTWSWST